MSKALIIGLALAVVIGLIVAVFVTVFLLAGGTDVVSELADGIGVSAASGSAVSWQTHRDPAGFVVEAPASWRIDQDPQSGRVVITEAGIPYLGPTVLVWPVYIPSPVSPQLAGQTARRLVARAQPAISWDAPQPVGRSVLRLTGRDPLMKFVAAFAWIPAGNGTVAYLYMISAPMADFRNLGPTFDRILGSFRLVGSGEEPQVGGQPQVSMTRWADPVEGAFSIEVPSGWTTRGGLVRAAAVDVRASWETISPDGNIRITAGDSQDPTFTVPSQILEMGGYREGSRYSPGFGVTTVVRSYLNGTEFARDYVQRTVASDSNIVFTQVRARPEAVETINRINEQFGGYGVSVRLDAGEVFFKCRKNEQPLSGYYFAGTQMVDVQGSAIWNAQYLCGYVAVDSMEAVARDYLNRIVASTQMNPDWVRRQRNLTSATTQIVTETSHAISNIISSTYENTNRVRGEISRRDSNARLGVEDVVDPLTGRQLKVESGSNYVWVNHEGTIVGTQTDSSPGFDFRQMTRLP